MKKHILLVFGSILILAAALAVVAVTMHTLTQPRIFASSAIVQVIFPESTSQRYDATALELLTNTQAELMTSESILNEVIENLKLQERWGREFSLAGPLHANDSRTILSNKIQVQQEPGTIGLISIRVFGKKPEEVARIANEFAMVYRGQVTTSAQQGGPYHVKMISRAEPELEPVSPRIFLNILIACGWASILIPFGILFIVFGIRIKKTVQPTTQPFSSSVDVSPPPLS